MSFKSVPLRSKLLLIYILLSIYEAEQIAIMNCSLVILYSMRIIGYPIFLIVLRLIYIITTMDPGVLSSKHNISIDCDNENNIQIQERCSSCNLIRPKHLNSIHHCRICNYCVIDFDHHCGVLGTCISKENLFYFKLLLVLGGIEHFILYNALECSQGSIFQSIFRIFNCISWNVIEMLEQIIIELYKRFFLWWYFSISMFLLSFAIFHIILNCYEILYYDIIKRNSNNRLCYSLRQSTCNISNSFKNLIGTCMHRLHIFVDLSHPFSYRGRCITPTLRWILNSFVTIPFIYYSFDYYIQLVFNHTNNNIMLSIESISLFLSMIFIPFGLYYMRLTILSINYHNAINISKHPKKITKENLSSYINDDYDNESTNLLNSEIDNNDHIVIRNNDNINAYQYYYCDICDDHWSLQDHHCGGFGVCIQKTNRLDYLRFCIYSSISLLLYLPSVIKYINYHWHINLFDYIIHNKPLVMSLYTQLIELFLPLISFYTIIGSVLFFTMCGLQQYAYILYEKEVSIEYHKLQINNNNIDYNYNTKNTSIYGNIQIKSTFIDTFIEIAYNRIEKKRFCIDICNEIRSISTCNII